MADVTRRGVVHVKAGLAWIVDTNQGTLTTPSGIRFSFDVLDETILSETFIYDIHYLGLDLSHATVITAGAHVGDTALYYAQTARQVLAVEPDPHYYMVLEKNLRLNPQLSDKVISVNAALGRYGSSKAESRGIEGVPSRGDSIAPTVNGKEICHSYRLGEIVEKFDLTGPFVCDLDVKGGEQLILDEMFLQNCQAVRIEYSLQLWEGRPSENQVLTIFEKLREKGFTRIRLHKHNNARIPLGIHATVLATREPEIQSES